MKCLDCGNTWKEYGNDGIYLPNIEEHQRNIEELRQFAKKREFSETNFGSLAKNRRTGKLGNRSSRSPVIGPLFAIAFLLVGGIVGTTWYLNIDANVRPQTGIALGDVRLKERIGRDGSKIITVRGSVENRTAKSARIPAIAIILRKNDGGEIVRWRHTSSLPVLKAGGKSRFASSIQYDTPAVAYAEAVFE